MTYTDQISKTIHLVKAPSRIVSLVPSQTELLYDLGLASEVVGITKFCTHPSEWRKTKSVIGGTKNPRIKNIELLLPDLIIANKEENNRDDIQKLEKFCPVWTSDVKNLSQAYEMIASIGEITNRNNQASSIIQEIENEFQKQQVADSRKKRSLYLIWKNPYMSVGSDTFIHSMMEEFDFENVLRDKSRYPTLNLEEINQLQPEIVFLSSEPYPFKDKDLNEIQKVVPRAKILLVDGKLFSWYGSRLKHSAVYIASLINKLGD